MGCCELLVAVRAWVCSPEAVLDAICRFRYKACVEQTAVPVLAGLRADRVVAKERVPAYAIPRTLIDACAG